MFKFRLILLATTLLTTFTVFSQQEEPETELSAEAQSSQRTTYVSPYRVSFTYPEAELIGDILHGRRGNPQEQSSYPHHLWDSRKILKRYGAWGPPARLYPPPEGISEKPAEWQRERIIATAMRFIGYSYQHHHIPDWEPPADWPWLKAPCGHNSKGIDCSNFTSFVYNQALGIKISGDIKIQGRETLIPSHEGRPEIQVEHIHNQGNYTEFVKSLRTGDLVYLVKKNGDAYHVVIWIGKIGETPDGKPLIIDSTGVVRNHDANGAAIPQGVHLRPFDEKSKYFTTAGHALRLIK